MHGDWGINHVKLLLLMDSVKKNLLYVLNIEETCMSYIDIIWGLFISIFVEFLMQHYAIVCDNFISYFELGNITT